MRNKHFLASCSRMVSSFSPCLSITAWINVSKSFLASSYCLRCASNQGLLLLLERSLRNFNVEDCSIATDKKRRQKAEGRRQKAEGRRQKAEVGENAGEVL